VGIIDIIKRAFEVANKNLLLVLVNAVLYIAAFIIVSIMLAVLVFAVIGSMSALPDNPQEVETFINSLAMSGGVIVVMVVAIIAISFMFWIAYSYVQAGAIGSILSTARGEKKGFEWGVFWENLKRFGLSILWLNIIWGFIALGILVVIGLAGLIGGFGVLMPLKDAGNATAAYGFGVPFFALLILFYMFCMFLVYAGTMLSGVTLIDRRIETVAAMSEAVGFIKKHFWDVLLLSLALLFGSFAVSMFFGIIRMFFGFIPLIGPIIGALVIMPIEMCVNIYIVILILSAFTVMLLDRTGGLPSPAGALPVGPETPSYIPPAAGFTGQAGDTGTDHPAETPPSTGMEFPVPGEDRGQGEDAGLSEEFPPQADEVPGREEGDFLPLEAEPVQEPEAGGLESVPEEPAEPFAPAVPPGMKPAPPPPPGTAPDAGLSVQQPRPKPLSSDEFLVMPEPEVSEEAEEPEDGDKGGEQDEDTRNE